MRNEKLVNPILMQTDNNCLSLVDDLSPPSAPYSHWHPKYPSDKTLSSSIIHAKYWIDDKMFRLFIKLLNKRPMGHIAHLRNQFKSMNTFERSYDYIYKCITKFAQWFRRRKIFNIVNVLLQFCYNLPILKRCGLSIWTNSNPLFTQGFF